MTELKRRRQKNIKVYRDEKGKYYVHSYPCPIHYFDEDTQMYEEYNGIIKSTGNRYVTIGRQSKTYFYANKDYNALMHMDTTDKYLSLLYKGEQRQKGGQERRIRIGPTTRPRIRFFDVSEDVDIEYTYEYEVLKANIVIKAPIEDTHFDFLLQTDGFLLKSNQERSALALFEKRGKGSRPYLLLTAPQLLNSRGIEHTLCYRARRISSGLYKISIDFNINWSTVKNNAYPLEIAYCLIDCRDWCEMSDEEQLKKTSAYEMRPFAMNVSQTWIGTNKNEAEGYSSQNWNTVGSTAVMIVNCEKSEDGSASAKVLGDGFQGNDFSVQHLPHWQVDYYDRRDYTPARERLTRQFGENCRVDLELDSGELAVLHTDMLLPGSVFEARIVHCYDSTYVNDEKSFSICPCGKGWRLSAQQRLEVIEEEGKLQYIYTDGFGKYHYFTHNEHDGIWEADGLYLLCRNSSMYKYYISDITGSKMVFDENGFLIRVYDENENFVNYIYKDGLLCKVNDSYGRVILLSYEDGLLSSILDPQKRKTTYTYDNTGRLISILRPGSDESSFAYDEYGRLTNIMNSSGQGIAISYESASNRVMKINQYTQVMRISHQQVLAGSSTSDIMTKIEYPSERMTVVTDSLGKRTVYHFDENSDCNKEIEAKEDAKVEHISIFGYDVTIVRRTISAKNGVTVITEYSEQEKLRRLTVEDEAGNRFTTVFQYDERGKLVASQDYRKIVTQYSYSAKGFLREVVRYYCPVFNEKESLVKPECRFIKEYYMDKNWEYIAIETDDRGDGRFLQFECDPKSGLLNHITNTNHVRTTFSYDHDTKHLTSIHTWAEGEGKSVEYGYTNGLLTKIIHNGFDCQYQYDGFGNLAGRSIAGIPISTIICDMHNRSESFSTGETITKLVDHKNRVISRNYLAAPEGELRVLWEAQYSKNDELIKTIDYLSKIECIYNTQSWLMEERKENRLTKAAYYNSRGWLKDKVLFSGDGPFTYTYYYDARDDGSVMPDGKLSGVSLADRFSEVYGFDLYGRVIQKCTQLSGDTMFEEEIGYLDTKRLTYAVRSLKQTICSRDQLFYTYIYEQSGRIGGIYGIEEGSDYPLVTYEYDGFGQLLRENNYKLGYTWFYSYDRGGNVMCRQRYRIGQDASEEETIFAYQESGWKDLLVSVNGCPIQYDIIGNPTIYYGNQLCWERIRLLKSYGSNIYNYDANGNRIQKNSTRYQLDGEQIASETTNGKTIYYYYGVNGLVGFQYMDKSYYYLKNLFGDVERIYDEKGNLVGEYAYDAWGNCTILVDINKVATVNPFRYKSYYYDRETGLYYFEKRYYDPSTGRFINPIDQVAPWSIYGCNLFLYACNDPVNATLIYGKTLITDRRAPSFYQQRLKDIQTTPLRSVIPYPEK